MKDALIQPAFAVFNSRRKYALLLGSGVSRSAEILTGEQIVDDLISQISAAIGEPISGNPRTWYSQRFGKQPGYDSLLESLGKTKLDRRAILRDKFEPTSDEREQGIKAPTMAHRAIAWLVKHRYVRIILTTNFDRLLESALEAEGIPPVVISTESQAENREPIQHYDVLIVKLHGDYLDEHTRNTPEELANYSPSMQQLMEQVISEYGLVICGWSGETDVALRDSLANHKRYAIYWSTYGTVSDEVVSLLESANVQRIHGLTSDEFFSELQDMVEALEGTKREPPLSVAIAVERVKKFIPREDMQIQLNDLLHNLTEKAYEGFTNVDFVQQIQQKAQEPEATFADLWTMYFKVTEIALNAFATFCLYGHGIQIQRLEQSISKWIEKPPRPEQIEGSFGHFPDVLLIYTCGIAATYARDWEYLRAILVDPKTKSRESNKRVYVLLETNKRTLELAQSYLMSGSRMAPQSPFIYETLKPIFLQHLSLENFNNSFDLFEVLFAAIYIHLSQDKDWMPVHSAYDNKRSWEFIGEFWSQEGASLSRSKILEVGLFNGKVIELYQTLQQYVALSKQFYNRKIGDAPPDYAMIYRKDRDLSRE